MSTVSAVEIGPGRWVWRTKLRSRERRTIQASGCRYPYFKARDESIPGDLMDVSTNGTIVSCSVGPQEAQSTGLAGMGAARRDRVGADAAMELRQKPTKTNARFRQSCCERWEDEQCGSSDIRPHVAAIYSKAESISHMHFSADALMIKPCHWDVITSTETNGHCAVFSRTEYEPIIHNQLNSSQKLVPFRCTSLKAVQLVPYKSSIETPYTHLQNAVSTTQDPEHLGS